MNRDKLLRSLLARDSRYPADAYQFIEDALNYAADSLALELQEYDLTYDNLDPFDFENNRQRHFTGEQLCEAIRLHAINQFGYLAKVVLRAWNIDSTSCFGDLVYNLIDVGLLSKSESDARSDFDNVYQFDDVFETGLEINPSIAQL